MEITSFLFKKGNLVKRFAALELPEHFREPAEPISSFGSSTSSSPRGLRSYQYLKAQTEQTASNIHNTALRTGFPHTFSVPLAA